MSAYFTPSRNMERLPRSCLSISSPSLLVLLYILVVVSQFVVHDTIAFTVPTILMKNQVLVGHSIMKHNHQQQQSLIHQSRSRQGQVLFLSDKNNNNENKDVLRGVIELDDDKNESTTTTTTSVTMSSSNVGPGSTVAAAPFLSQGEIDPQALNPDLSDPKQARVIIYILLSLLPVLFLVPFMLGSRDLIPLDALPPVEL